MNYIELYRRVKEFNCTDQTLNDLKVLFKSDINSNRRYYSIQTLNDLIQILEKRDVINVHNYDALLKIYGVLNLHNDTLNTGHISDINRNISDTLYLNPNTSNIIQNPNNSNASAFNFNLNSSQLINQASVCKNKCCQSMGCFRYEENTCTKEAYQLICEEIGSKWKDLARALDIREADIDDLERCSRIYDRTMKVLLKHEKISRNKFEWACNLKNALQKARRGDLRIKIEKIINQY